MGRDAQQRQRPYDLAEQEAQKLLTGMCRQSTCRSSQGIDCVIKDL